MKIWKKIILGFITVIAIMIVVDYNALRNNIRLINQVKKLESSNRLELTQSNKMAYLTQRVKSNIRELFLEMGGFNDPDEIINAHRVINESMLQIAQSVKAMKDATLVGATFEELEVEGENYPNEGMELILIDSLEVMIINYTALVNEVLSLVDYSEYNNAVNLFETDLEPVSRQIQELIIVLVRDSEAEVANSILRMDASADRAINLGVSLTILSVLLSLGIGLFISRSISKPLNKLIDSTNLMGKGNFESKVEIKSGDELELLGSSFNIMADELKTKISAIDNLNKELLESNHAKDTLFSVIAHDLKNPFNIILGYANLLATQYDDFDEASRREFVEQIDKSSKITFELLENLLTWARFQTGKIEIKKEKVNLAKFIDKCVAAYFASAKAKKIRILNNIPKELIISADKFTLSVVVGNLINNAIKFTNKGGEINIMSKITDNHIVLKVKDNGVGMDEATLQNLLGFDRAKSVTGTDNEKGTGLGLVLVKDFIKKNGGKFEIESKIGVGSLFSFSLPL